MVSVPSESVRRVEEGIRAPEPFLRWIRREWPLALVTFGIGIDSLPVLLTAQLPQLAPLSGTRFVVLPALIVALLRRPSWLIRPHALGLAYLVALVAGGGLGWIEGTVPSGRIAQLLVNGALLLYYADVRSFDSIRHVLMITFVLSFTVPIVQDLAAIGVLSRPFLESLGMIEIGTRVFSIYDTTSPGFIPIMIPACLGGLIFVSGKQRRPLLTAALAAAAVMFGITSALVAQQRSGVLAYAATLLVAIALYLRAHAKRMVWLLAGFGLVALLAAEGARGVISPAAERFSDAQALEESRDLRLGSFLVLFSDLADDPFRLVPIGNASVENRTGLAPHLLVSEAYYSGGPLLLVVVLVLLFRFARASLRLMLSREPRARMIGHCLCAFGAGALVVIMLQTALGLRIIPLMFGVAIAGERLLRVRHAVAMPSRVRAVAPPNAAPTRATT